LKVLAEDGWCCPSKAEYHSRQPIANKYRKGKLKSTSCEELKVHEIRLIRMGHPSSSKGVG